MGAIIWNLFWVHVLAPCVFLGCYVFMIGVGGDIFSQGLLCALCWWQRVASW